MDECRIIAKSLIELGQYDIISKWFQSIGLLESTVRDLILSAITSSC